LSSLLGPSLQADNIAILQVVELLFFLMVRSWSSTLSFLVISSIPRRLRQQCHWFWYVMNS
jgi:hypothetical protein